MDLNRYVRRPKEVTAVQVTQDNIIDVAQWCGGTIHKDSIETKKYIELPGIERRRVERLGRAYVGDWVTLRKNSYLSYSPQSFRTLFMPKDA